MKILEYTDAALETNVYTSHCQEKQGTVFVVGRGYPKYPEYPGTDASDFSYVYVDGYFDTVGWRPCLELVG